MNADGKRMRAYLPAGAAIAALDRVAGCARTRGSVCCTMSGDGNDRDQFLSEEDLDLRNLSWDELLLWWDECLRQAQSSNHLDADEYSHGVFALPRREWPKRA